MSMFIPQRHCPISLQARRQHRKTRWPHGAKPFARSTSEDVS